VAYNTDPTLSRRLQPGGYDGIVTALTDYGVDELRDMIAAARCSPTKWDQFLDDFVNDPDIIARVKAQTPR